MSTNLQAVIEQQRVVYDSLAKPLLQQMAEIHGLSIREFAEIFGVSKGHAEGILKHRCFPSLPLAVAISRYFEVSVEELFGWRVDDEGARRPLLVDPGDGVIVRLSSHDHGGGALSLVRGVAEKIK